MRLSFLCNHKRHSIPFYDDPSINHTCTPFLVCCDDDGRLATCVQVSGSPVSPLCENIAFLLLAIEDVMFLPMHFDRSRIEIFGSLTLIMFFSDTNLGSLLSPHWQSSLFLRLKLCSFFHQFANIIEFPFRSHQSRVHSFFPGML